jgi:hypothetical protein
MTAASRTGRYWVRLTAARPRTAARRRRLSWRRRVVPPTGRGGRNCACPSGEERIFRPRTGRSSAGVMSRRSGSGNWAGSRSAMAEAKAEATSTAASRGGGHSRDGDVLVREPGDAGVDRSVVVQDLDRAGQRLRIVPQHLRLVGGGRASSAAMPLPIRLTVVTYPAAGSRKARRSARPRPAGVPCPGRRSAR